MIELGSFVISAVLPRIFQGISKAGPFQPHSGRPSQCLQFASGEHLRVLSGGSSRRFRSTHSYFLPKHIPIPLLGIKESVTCFEPLQQCDFGDNSGLIHFRLQISQVFVRWDISYRRLDQIVIAPL